METVKTISIILAIVVLIIIIIVGCLTDLLRETNNKTSPYSFSRVQLFLWTLTIAPIFALHWGYRYFPGTDPDLINTTGLILLGISGSVALTAGVIGSTQLATAKAKGLLPIMLKSTRVTVNFWVDILTDDNGQFSIARLQQLIFTLVFMVIYVATFFADDKALPEFNEPYVFVLMGISTGSYVLGKAMNK